MLIPLIRRSGEPAGSPPPWWVPLVVVLACIGAVLATVWIVQTARGVPPPWAGP